jgi:hypothetical protein
MSPAFRGVYVNVPGFRWATIGAGPATDARLGTVVTDVRKLSQPGHSNRQPADWRVQTLDVAR